MFIFCFGMMRSGSTLQFQLVARLVEAAGVGERVPWTEPEDFASCAASVRSDQRWRVFKAHWCNDAMRDEFVHHNARGVGIHRDLRDVMVSHADKYDKPITPEHCRRFISQCLESFSAWDGLPRTMITRYDELTTDPVSVITRMAEHLELPCTAQQAVALAREYSLAAQRERIDRAQRTAVMQPAWSGGPTMMKDELLHEDHIADGRTGKWTHRFDAACRAAVDELAGDWLVQHGYERSSDFPPMDAGI